MRSVSWKFRKTFFGLLSFMAYSLRDSLKTSVLCGEIILWTLLEGLSVQLLSGVWLFAPPWTAAWQASLSISNSQSFLKLIHQVGDAIEPSHPLSFPSPSAFSLSQHKGLFDRVSSSYQVGKVLSFSFSISPSNEYPGLISFMIDWFDTLLNYLFVFHLFGN